MLQLAKECKNSITKLDINETITVLFVQCGVNLENAEKKAPFYTDRLAKEKRQDLILKAILSLADTWTSENYGAPTVGDILAKYKMLKYREANKFQSRHHKQNNKTGQLFWSEFYKCTEDGMTDINKISQVIMKKIGGDTVKRSVCKHNFCDGKGYLYAVKKDDPYRCETIFQCQCNDKTDPAIGLVEFDCENCEESVYFK